MADSATGGGSGKKLGLTVEYRSRANPVFNFSKPLDAPAGEGVESKTKYLRDLRSAVVASQDEINRELTARMEEDRAREAQDSKSAADDAKEEENYGEEVQEED